MDLREWLQDRLDRLDGKLDAVQKKCAEIDVALAAQAKDLAYYMQQVDTLDDRLDQVSDVAEEAVKPTRWAKTTAKILGYASTAVGLSVGLFKLVEYAIQQ